MTRKGIVTLSIIGIMILAVLLFIIGSKSYYPPLPVDSLSKQAALKLLNSSSEGLVKLADEEQFSWYGFKGNQQEGSRMLQSAMQDRAWTFKEQDGAGYFFVDKDEDTKIVISQMWTSSFILYKIPK